MFTWHVLTQIMYFVNVFALCVYLYRSHFYYFQYYVAFVYLSEFIIVLCFPNCCFTNKTFTTHTGTQVFIVERHLIDLFLCRPCTFKRFAKFIQSCKGRGNWYIYICPLPNQGQKWGLMPPPRPIWISDLERGKIWRRSNVYNVEFAIFWPMTMTMISMIFIFNINWRDYNSELERGKIWHRSHQCQCQKRSAVSRANLRHVSTNADKFSLICPMLANFCRNKEKQWEPNLSPVFQKACEIWRPGCKKVARHILGNALFDKSEGQPNQVW